MPTQGDGNGLSERSAERSPQCLTRSRSRLARVSRRVLEARFKERLGRSPHQEILRARVERIRVLLLETDLTIAAIARRAGFQHVEYLTVVFKRALGCTPSAYRERAG